MTEEKEKIIELLNWVTSFLLKKNNLQNKGIWTERDYYIDGKGYHVAEEWIYLNGRRAELQEIKPLRDFIIKK